MPICTQTRPAPHQPQRVAVLAFDRISPFHLCVPSIVLGEASPISMCVVAMESGPLRTTAGFTIASDWGWDAGAGRRGDRANLARRA